MKVEFYQPHGFEHANANLQDNLLRKFGGFTAVQANGAYKALDGKHVVEPVEVISCYSKESATSLKPFLTELALQYGREAAQESVLFVLDGEPELVFTTEAHAA